MRLSTFVHDTLYEIVLGISLGRARSRELAAIAPLTIDEKSVSEKTYVDFDIAVVVGEDEENASGGDGKLKGEIQVASVLKVSANAGGKIESKTRSSSEQTHRISFKVPLYTNAHFRENATVIAESQRLLTAYGIKDSGDPSGPAPTNGSHLSEKA
jgi:hypothetical protein